MEYLLWTPLLLNPNKIKRQAKFRDEFKAAFGKPINNQVCAGYDGMIGVGLAFKMAGSIEPEKVVQAIAKTNYLGVLGRYSYDLKRHEIKAGVDFIPIPTAQIIKGKSTIIWPPQLGRGRLQKTTLERISHRTPPECPTTAPVGFRLEPQTQCAMRAP